MTTSSPQTLPGTTPIAGKRPWWTTASNPPCVSWCEVAHEPHEFAGGGFLCRKTILRTDAFQVDVQLFTGTDETNAPGVYESEPAAVWFHMQQHDEVSPAVARRRAREFALAMTEAATVCERTVQA